MTNPKHTLESFFTGQEWQAAHDAVQQDQKYPLGEVPLEGEERFSAKYYSEDNYVELPSQIPTPLVKQQLTVDQIGIQLSSEQKKLIGQYADAFTEATIDMVGTDERGVESTFMSLRELAMSVYTEGNYYYNHTTNQTTFRTLVLNEVQDLFSQKVWENVKKLGLEYRFRDVGLESLFEDTNKSFSEDRIVGQIIDSEYSRIFSPVEKKLALTLWGDMDPSYFDFDRAGFTPNEIKLAGAVRFVDQSDHPVLAAVSFLVAGGIIARFPRSIYLFGALGVGAGSIEAYDGYTEIQNARLTDGEYADVEEVYGEMHIGGGLTTVAFATGITSYAYLKGVPLPSRISSSLEAIETTELSPTFVELIIANEKPIQIPLRPLRPEVLDVESKLPPGSLPGFRWGGSPETMGTGSFFARSGTIAKLMNDNGNPIQIRSGVLDVKANSLPGFNWGNSSGAVETGSFFARSGAATETSGSRGMQSVTEVFTEVVPQTSENLPPLPAVRPPQFDPSLTDFVGASIWDLFVSRNPVVRGPRPMVSSPAAPLIPPLPPFDSDIDRSPAILPGIDDGFEMEMPEISQYRDLIFEVPGLIEEVMEMPSGVEDYEHPIGDEPVIEKEDIIAEIWKDPELGREVLRLLREIKRAEEKKDHPKVEALQEELFSLLLIAKARVEKEKGMSAGWFYRWTSTETLEEKALEGDWSAVEELVRRRETSLSGSRRSKEKAAIRRVMLELRDRANDATDVEEGIRLAAMAMEIRLRSGDQEEAVDFLKTMEARLQAPILARFSSQGTSLGTLWSEQEVFDDDDLSLIEIEGVLNLEEILTRYGLIPAGIIDDADFLDTLKPGTGVFVYYAVGNPPQLGMLTGELRQVNNHEVRIADPAGENLVIIPIEYIRAYTTKPIGAKSRRLTLDEDFRELVGYNQYLAPYNPARIEVTTGVEGNLSSSYTLQEIEESQEWLTVFNGKVMTEVESITENAGQEDLEMPPNSQIFVRVILSNGTSQMRLAPQSTSSGDLVISQEETRAGTGFIWTSDGGQVIHISSENEELPVLLLLEIQESLADEYDVKVTVHHP